MDNKQHQVNIITLCDYAQEYNGRLMIVGAFNSLVINKFPYVYQDLALVVRFAPSSPGEHRVEFSIKEINGRFTLMEKQSFKINTSANLRNPYANLIIKGSYVTIPEAGDYKVIFKIDEQEFSTIVTISDARNSNIVKENIQLGK